MRRFAFVLLFVLFAGPVLFSQTHVSVPVDHAVYYLLDLAEARGLCSPLPAVKPLTRGRVVEAINEILAAEPRRFGALNDTERKMLEDARAEFTKGEAGLDLWKGMYRFDVRGKKGVRFSGDFGIAMESLNSAAFYKEESDTIEGTDTWGIINFKGDVGDNFSFAVDFSGGVLKAYREELGQYDTYGTELVEKPDWPDGAVNQRVTVYSQPRAFFPYTYQKGWDGFLFGSGGFTTTSMEFWPNGFSLAPRLLSEMAGSVFGDSLLLRVGRLQREWGAMTPGSSLVYNAAARPFVGVEATFNPVSWFAFSSVTGILEFDNNSAGGSIRTGAWNFQSAFSLQQMEFNYKNYFHIDFGGAAIWPKRFELGYMFPLFNNFLYQNLIGKFDNMLIHMNVRGRYPGLGGVWFSFIMDEMELSSMGSAFELDRHMFAFQAGLQVIIPRLPFASVSASYTKVEPYTYTHTRDFVPWESGDQPMVKSYSSNGVSLGHYLPPNSDEIKVRFDARPWLRTAGHLQYQLIRHGADFGPHQVDGSSLISELDVDRSNKASLEKDFLNDGAYQWMHIIKIGAEYKFDKLPLTVFGEAGVVYSYFTDISDEKYAYYIPTPAGGTPRSPAEGVYTTSTAFILTLGFKVFR